MAPAPSQTYHERPPAPQLAGVVSAIWIQQVAPSAAPYTHRSVPNGAVELACRVGGHAELVGPRTAPTVDVLAPGSTVVGVRLRPGTGPALLGVSPAELTDLAVTTEEVWGDSALGERVAAAEMPERAAAMLERQIAAG